MKRTHTVYETGVCPNLYRIQCHVTGKRYAVLKRNNCVQCPGCNGVAGVL